MKAAVLSAINQPLEILDLTEQDPEVGQVKVKVLYSGLCRSQLMEMQGGRGNQRYIPHMLGHEGVGVVESVGEGVGKVAVGDKVVLGWIKSSGKDAPGAVYQYGKQQINSGSVTTLCEKTIVAENRLVKLPDGVPERVAILFGCALPTGAGIVFNQLKPEPDSTILIWGLGGVGLSALIAAKSFKPRRLIAVDLCPNKLSLAKELGADVTLNADSSDVVNEIRSMTEGGVDYAVEAGGSTRTIEQAFESIKDGGLCVFASHPPDGNMMQLEPHAFHRGKRLVGSWGGASQPERDIPKLAELFRTGQLPLERLLSESYSLDDVNKAVLALDNAEIVRAVIDMSLNK